MLLQQRASSHTCWYYSLVAITYVFTNEHANLTMHMICMKAWRYIQDRYVVKQHLRELYGHRGDNVELASLSPYEFHEHWFCQRVNYPTISPMPNTETFILAGHEVYSNNGNIYHALLIVAGRQQLIEKLPLQAGIHYIVSEETGLTRDRRRLAFPKSSPFADEYVMALG